MKHVYELSVAEIKYTLLTELRIPKAKAASSAVTALIMRVIILFFFFF